MKVFLLEDDPIFQKLLKEDLAEMGHEIVTWECVEGAKEQIREGDFDLLIIDIVLPYKKEASGYECPDGGIRVLEGIVREKLPPTVFITVKEYNEFQRRVEALSLMAFGYDVPLFLTKPYDKIQLKEIIDRIEETLAEDRIAQILIEARRILALSAEAGRVLAAKAMLKPEPMLTPAKTTLVTLCTVRKLMEELARVTSTGVPPTDVTPEDKGLLGYSEIVLGIAQSFVERVTHSASEDLQWMPETPSEVQKLLGEAAGEAAGILTEANRSLITPVCDREELSPTKEALVAQRHDVRMVINHTGEGFILQMFNGSALEAMAPLSLDDVDDMIAQVRDDLGSIVHSGPPGNKIYQTSFTIDKCTHKNSLYLLARCGFWLFQKIFHCAGDDLKRVGDALRESAHGESLRIRIYSKRFLIPWSILYIADKVDENDVRPEMFLGFKHVIEQVPFQPKRRLDDSVICSDPSLGVCLNFNVDIDKQMGVPFVEDQRKYFAHIKDIGTG